MSHGRVRELVDNQLNSELASAGKKLVVVDYTAVWCPPCKAIAPIFEQLSQEYQDVVFLKVDVDQCKSTAQAQGIRAMPTFQFFLDKQKVHEFSGADRSQLKSSIERLKPKLSFESQGQALGGGGGSSGGGFQTYLDTLQRKQEEQQRQYQQQVGTTTPAPNPLNNLMNDSNKPTTKPSVNRNIVPDPVMLRDLIDMGFPEFRSKKALVLTNNSSSQAAMDWIFENMDSETIDDPIEGIDLTSSSSSSSTATNTTSTTTTSTSNTDNNNNNNNESNTTTTTTTSTSNTEQPTTVHNALCDICTQQIIGYRYKCKVCPNYDLCQSCKDKNTHNPNHEFAQHEKDIENYVMTPEEKAEQKRRLENKVLEIRAKKAEDEAKREIEREINRRQGGKMSQDALTKWKEDQMKREAEKDRKEKEADRIAKAKIKAKVEADRLERMAKKNATAGGPTSTDGAAKPVVAATPQPVVQQTPTKTYTDSLIQIRLSDGNTIKGTFPVTAKLIDVHTFISKNTSQHGKFTLSTTYPRKIYTQSELSTTSVEEAGLVPNGTLVCTKQ